jgi:hypothetical protein
MLKVGMPAFGPATDLLAAKSEFEGIPAGAPSGPDAADIPGGRGVSTQAV